MYESVAVVGATGAVGTIILKLLESRKFPFRSIKFLASERSAGKRITFCGTAHTVEELRPEAFDGVRAGHCQHAGRRGAGLHSRGRRPRLRGDRRKRLLADGPQGAAGDSRGQSARHRAGTRASSPAPIARRRRWSQALKPLHDAGRVRRVIVSTYQATSGAGLSGTRDLDGSTRAAARRPGLSATRRSPIRSPSTAFRRSARPSTRATRRKK